MLHAAFALVALVALVTPIPARAVTRFASNSGVDSPTCGAAASRCRSITQAVLNSAPGDRVIVGPGIYSDDLDGDSIAGEPGEEPGQINIGVAGLAVQSSGGAAATLIHRRLGAPSNGVLISANGVKFGRLGKGFTVMTQGNVNSTNVSVTAPTGVEVIGNVITGTINFGFGVTGTGGLLKDNRVLCGPGGGAIGVALLAAQDTRVERNAVQGCSIAFIAAGPGIVLTRNLASGNGTGFNLGSIAEMTRNAALGNSSTGATLNPGAVLGLIASNTFSGNATIASPLNNCGLYNNTGGHVIATDNFWGSVTGPGPDPADQVCNAVGSSTTTTPFATVDVTPRMAAMR
jgi:hypothetical protein